MIHAAFALLLAVTLDGAPATPEEKPVSYEVSDGWFVDVNGHRVVKDPADMPHTTYSAGFPKGILWHYTAGCNDNIKGTLESNGFGGAPFIVGRDGTIRQYAPVFAATWHAREAGHFYIGIEHASRGPGSTCPLTEAQLEASAALSAAIVELVKDKHGFEIPLVKLDPPVRLNEWRPGFLDHTDGPNALEAGGADKTWNDAGHVDGLFRWSWAKYLGVVKSHLEDDMTAEERAKLDKLYNFLKELDGVVDPDAPINAAVLGRLVGRTVLQSHDAEPPATDALTRAEADLLYAKKSDHPHTASTSIS